MDTMGNGTKERRLAGYYYTPLQKSGQANAPLHCENRNWNYYTGVSTVLETGKEVLLAAFYHLFCYCLPNLVKRSEASMLVVHIPLRDGNVRWSKLCRRYLYRYSGRCVVRGRNEVLRNIVVNNQEGGVRLHDRDLSQLLFSGRQRFSVSF